jgi:hypothetical protein
MDYTAKYLKYKLKFLNLRKQIGGAVIWQREGDRPNQWVDFSAADSQFIERNHGTFQLPSMHMITKINRDTGFQQGKVRKRAIRRIIIEGKTLAQKLLETVRNFPAIWTYRNHDTFRNDLVSLFSKNAQIINEIWGQPDSFETIPRANDELFKGIITVSNPSMTDDELLKLIERILMDQKEKSKREMREFEEYKRQKEKEDRKFEGFLLNV